MSEWTRTPPTEPGDYWVCHEGHDNPHILTFAGAWIGIEWTDWADTETLVRERYLFWTEPIRPPPIRPAPSPDGSQG